MLAAPLHPASSFASLKPGEEIQVKPAKDLDAFNALLPPAIEFVEGSSTRSIFEEVVYTPINVSPRSKNETLQPQSPLLGKNVATLSPSVKKTHGKGVAGSSDVKALYTGPIDTTWPAGSRVGRGFNNVGNTCFLNSALQCLLHTAPLVRILLAHQKDETCRPQAGFCMACTLRQTLVDSQTKSTPTAPYLVITKLQHIAKHMRRGRQEDSHEFLRYAVDALQKSCLHGYPSKMDAKLAETTWVHQIFGGRLRSRVTCGECGHHSDTLDRILDLSIDIFGVNSVRDALRKFVAVDHLKGTNKYKCEKCKKLVLAEKQFTIHEAPTVLTIHLKRFSPMGRKIGHPLQYDERLSLKPYMSDGSFGPSYSLFGVICHAGGGPNSGHYYAHVKDGTGGWHEMNDETVASIGGAPLSLKNAYVLFYLRDRGQVLESAISSVVRDPSKSGLVAGMKKRRFPSYHEADEDTGVPTSPVTSRPTTPAKFIGPLLPSPDIPSPGKKRKMGDSHDPQAEVLRKKIEAVTTGPKGTDEKQVKAPTPTSALQSLAQYVGDEDEDEDEGEAPSQEEIEKAKEKLPIPSVVSTISTSNFYGGSSPTKIIPFKNKSNLQQQPGSPKRGRSDGAGTLKKKKSFAHNPYNRVTNDGFRRGPPIQRYGRKKRLIF